MYEYWHLLNAWQHVHKSFKEHVDKRYVTYERYVYRCVFIYMWRRENSETPPIVSVKHQVVEVLD